VGLVNRQLVKLYPLTEALTVGALHQDKLNKKENALTLPCKSAGCEGVGQRMDSHGGGLQENPMNIRLVK
jgi:hypothetical protein